MRELRGYGLTWQDMDAIYGRPGSGRAGAWAGMSPVPAPAPSPAPAQAPAAAPPAAQAPAQYLPAGWASRNAAADIEAATAPVAQARDFESFGPGGPVLKDTTPSSSPSSPSSTSSGAGLGLLGLLAFLMWR